MSPNTPTTRDENQRNENRFETICRLTKSIAANMNNSLRQIDDINMQVRLLSFNAQVQAAKAGEAGRTFSVVANEIGNLSTKTAGVAESLAAQTSQDIKQLAEISEQLASEVSGNRLVDLALTNIDLIDRNLYERSCDVRWWATDASAVDALSNPTPEKRAHASKRLGVILDAYTVYYDIVLCDLHGNVVANGRPDRFRSAGLNVSASAWFQEAIGSTSGNQFGFQSVHASQLVAGKHILAYSCSVREQGAADGKLLVLENVDQPGMVGTVGTILGKANVNIADMDVGKSRQGSSALMLIAPTSPIPAGGLDALRRSPGITSVHALRG